jgi:hypothetical protein
MNGHWLDEIKKRLLPESDQESGVQFDRLREMGIIDDRGEVTGRLHRWDAFLAITGIKHAGPDKIAVFRCLKPVFGMPGGATIDVSRESMLGYLREGKKITTAIRDDRLDMWKEANDVHISPNGFIQAGCTNGEQDNVGSLPEFQQSTSRL